MAGNVSFCLTLNAILFLDNSATLYKLNVLVVVQITELIYASDVFVSVIVS